jgi:hypothetical protein
MHFLRCMARRSPHSFSQIFPARKTSTLRFHRCGGHILQKPPLVPRLGLHHPSPKVGITPSFPSAPNIRETGKITCYWTKPTHISLFTSPAEPNCFPSLVVTSWGYNAGGRSCTTYISPHHLPTSFPMAEKKRGNSETDLKKQEGVVELMGSHVSFPSIP